MARRRKRASRKEMNMPARRKYNCAWWHMLSGKLWGAAFILFLITAWPAAMDLVHSIHWGWFLGATILFSVLHFAKCKYCR